MLTSLCHVTPGRQERGVQMLVPVMILWSGRAAPRSDHSRKVENGPHIRTRSRYDYLDDPVVWLVGVAHSRARAMN